ncbi:MAG: 3-phosphoshikimate 1-carboxyvinyltransferase, partial [Actinomycetota bacterium]
MNRTVQRISAVDGQLSAVVEVPGSKSVANRALVCAALADGESLIERVAPGDDTSAMVDCLGLLGVRAGEPDGEPDGEHGEDVV